MYRKLTTAAAVAALAFGLAACGGGGGGDDTADTPTTTDPMPMPPPTAAVTIPDGMYLDADNAPSAGMMTIAAGESATNNGVIFSCPAGGDACEVEVAADGSVTSTGGEATAALSADAMTQVAQAKQDAQEEADRMALENRDRIIGKDRALEAAANIAVTTGTADTLEEDDISISRAAGAMARVRVADPSGYTASDGAILPNAGWQASRLMRNVGTTATQHLFVYTDIEAPTRIQFYDFDRDSMTPARYTDTSPPSHTDPYGPDDTITGLALTVGAGGNFSAATSDASRFPAPLSVEEGSTSQRYTNNARNADDSADIVSIPGNFNGAGGRYECSGGTATDPCQVTVAPNGSYTLVGTWTFVPELNATAWQGDQEFMSFGWWLQEPTAQTGSYTFRYYADGNPYSIASGTNLAAGSAIYNGRAAGKFVVQEIDNTGVVDGEAGMFTAAASLTARFTGTGAGGTLEGTISGFESDNSGVDVSGWSVALNRQTLTDTAGTSLLSTGGGQIDPTAPGFDGATATMGDQTAHGDWTSQFFGQPTTADAYPLGVGGTFQADNEAASIAGAFGARR